MQCCMTMRTGILLLTAFWLAGCEMREEQFTRAAPVAAERPSPYQWTALKDDGYHDPTNPGIEILQQPAQVLSKLPRDSAFVGNKVNWPKALDDQTIQPRTNIFPETKVKVLDLNILMKRTGNSNYVLFPHKPHTKWLDCANCHDKIFKMKTGETPLSMFAILNGEYCGRCHGAVAFPLIACTRCHSVVPGTEHLYKIDAIKEVHNR